MNINLSPSEIGIIVNALQTEYSSSSDEYILALNLCNSVYEHFKEMDMSSLYDDWVIEYEIIE